MRHRYSFLTLGLIALLLAIASCANPGSGPDGGPYDETPPRIVGMTSPQDLTAAHLRRGKTRITLLFDERVNVADAQDKIIVSPPQTEQPEVKTDGKRVSVTLLDTIRPGLTYTVDFSDAITDATEDNPLGHFTYIFSTGEQTDTMQVAGHVLSADLLEPLQGILVGLHSDLSDSAFTARPFDRVARTDRQGYFSIKGVAADRPYRIYALQDMDGDYRFSDKGETIGWSDEDITTGAYPDVRYDTLWVDSLRWDDIRVIPYTHFTPDDITLLAFREAAQPRYLLKAQREEPERFTAYFTAPGQRAPVVSGIGFDAARSLVEQRSAHLDTITYYLRDAALVCRDSLAIAYSYEMWDDTLGSVTWQTDTLELRPKVPYERREKMQAEELAKWEKAREKRHKRGDYSDETPPTPRLTIKHEMPNPMPANGSTLLTFSQPIDTCDTQRIRLLQRIDTTYCPVPFVLDSVPHNILARRLRAAWQPATQYRLEVDSAAVVSILGLTNEALQSDITVAPDAAFATLFVTLLDAPPTLRVALLDGTGKVAYEVRPQSGIAEFYYVNPATYYLRAYDDANDNGEWDAGIWATRTKAEAVYYNPTALDLKADWDYDQTWRLNALPLTQQKPQQLMTSPNDSSNNKKRSTAHERNLQRLQQRGQR